jgi:hypothetical protein
MSNSSTGVNRINGDLTKTTGNVVISSTLETTIAGTVSAVLSSLNLASAGTNKITGDSSNSLESLIDISSGKVQTIGSASNVLGALSATSFGTVDNVSHEIDLNVLLQPMTSNVALKIQVRGNGLNTLDNIQYSGGYYEHKKPEVRRRLGGGGGGAASAGAASASSAAVNEDLSILLSINISTELCLINKKETDFIIENKKYNLRHNPVKVVATRGKVKRNTKYFDTQEPFDVSAILVLTEPETNKNIDVIITEMNHMVASKPAITIMDIIKLNSTMTVSQIQPAMVKKKISK